MAKIELGRIGATVGPGSGDAFVADVVELERLGYETVWLTGGQTESLDQIAAAVRGTERVRIAGGIIAVSRFPAPELLALHADLAANHPGRLVVGLGGAHGERPFDILNAYLDEIAAAIPPSEIVLAALGPRMLGLARDRASGAFPVLVTPEFVGEARQTLGDDTTLAIDQLVVVDGDPERARETARQPLGFLGTMPAYQANFRRMGFSDDEISSRADRLVDGLVAWGDPEEVAAHVEALQAAGADHVALSVVAAPGASAMDAYRQLASVLLG